MHALPLVRLLELARRNSFAQARISRFPPKRQRFQGSGHRGRAKRLKNGENKKTRVQVRPPWRAPLAQVCLGFGRRTSSARLGPLSAAMREGRESRVVPRQPATLARCQTPGFPSSEFRVSSPHPGWRVQLGTWRLGEPSEQKQKNRLDDFTAMNGC